MINTNLGFAFFCLSAKDVSARTSRIAPDGRYPLPFSLFENKDAFGLSSRLRPAGFGGQAPQYKNI
jgi:hypothetical protein